MSKKEQKHDDSLLLQESSPASMLEVKQHRISNFFKVLDTTPNTTNDGKMIFPVTAAVDLDSDPESKDYPVMNRSAILVKEKVSVSMDKFKKDILGVIDEQNEQLSNKLQVVQEQLTQAELSQEQHAKEIEELKKEKYDLARKCQIQAGQIAKNEKDIQYLKGDVIELQAKSMMGNLIFYNIKEAPNESSEVTKTLLKAFMKDELKIAEDTVSTVTFDIVHRLGKQRLHKTRPIVAKFNPYKRKEIVLSHLKNLDKRKKFGVSEQIPDEMRSRKKTLMPKFQEARKKQQKPKWRQDRLLIGQEIF